MQKHRLRLRRTSHIRWVCTKKIVLTRGNFSGCASPFLLIYWRRSYILQKHDIISIYPQERCFSYEPHVHETRYKALWALSDWHSSDYTPNFATSSYFCRHRWLYENDNLSHFLVSYVPVKNDRSCDLLVCKSNTVTDPFTAQKTCPKS